MPVIELYRHDLTLLKAASVSDTRQIPAGSASIDLYWKGARVSGPASGTVGVVIPVYDPGTFSINDSVKKNGVGTAGSVTAVTATTITVTWGAAVSVDDGDRLILTARALGAARPSAYEDSQGSSLIGSTVTTGATSGGASFYTKPRDVDFVATVDGQTAVLADQSGQGADLTEPFNFGVTADGSTDDSAALARLVNYITLKGKTEINLPPGTIHVASSWVISTALTVRGAGRGATYIQGTAALSPVVQITANDALMEALTVTRSSTGAAASKLVEITGANNTLRTCGFQSGAIAIRDNGVDNTFEDITFSGSGWECFYFADQAQGFHCSNFRGYSDTAISASNAAYILDGARDGRMVNCHSQLSGLVTGRALHITQSTANLPTGLVFMGCKWIAANSAATPDQPVATVEFVAGARFVACDLSYGQNGYHFNAASDVQVIGGSVVSCQENSVKITGGVHVHLIELLSSDNNGGSYADSRADHVNIQGGVSSISVNGLTCGRLVVGTGPQARNGVKVEAGAGSDIQVMGVRGQAADLTGEFVSSESTSQRADIGHNFTKSGKSSIHTATPGGYVAQGQAGTKVLIAAETTTDVANVSSIILVQTGNTVWTGLTNGREGQLVTFVNSSGSFTATFNDGATFQLGNASRVLSQDDTLTLINVGSKWIEVAFGNNL